MLPNDSNNQPKVGVGLMIIRDGQLLLGKRKKGYGASTYGWIGGHLEFGETLEECARREALEEAGLSDFSLRLISVSDIIALNHHYADIEFLTLDIKSEPKVLEPDNVESWDWYDMSNLPSPLFEPVKKAIQSYQSGVIYNSRLDTNND